MPKSLTFLPDLGDKNPKKTYFLFRKNRIRLLFLFISIFVYLCRMKASDAIKYWPL
jgi:hypothetical protein